MFTPMKYSEEQLRLEIVGILDGKQERREALHPIWITHEICKRHESGLAKSNGVDELDIAFWEYGGYTITRKLVTRCINEREEPQEQATTPYLPGYEYLQHYYVHRRDGVDVGVPIEESTNEELRAKARLYRAQAGRLIQHANELDRYVDLREAQKPAVGH